MTDFMSHKGIDEFLFLNYYVTLNKPPEVFALFSEG